MSNFNSQKYQAVRAIIEQEQQKTSDVTIRQRCIARIKAEVGMSDAGASTYFSNMHKAMGGTVRPVVPVAVSTETTKEPVFSMVTVDAAKRAIDVRCFTDKNACLEKCNELNKHFIIGHQKRGAPLGTFVSPKAFDHLPTNID